MGGYKFMGGKQIRLSRLFNPRTGRTVIIPVDHGLIMGSVPGLSDPAAVLEKLVELEIDATLISAGLGKNTVGTFKGKNAPSRILTADFPMISNVPGEFEGVLSHEAVATVEYALRWGFDAVKVLFPWGLSREVQARTIKMVADFANACDLWGMPLMIEPVLWGDSIPKERKSDPMLIEHAARIALELGADIIKMPYTGDVEHFSNLIDRLRVPVVVLGGPKMKSTRDVLKVAKESIDAGALGIVFGRNVWQHPNMESMVNALKDIVHNNASMDDVLDRYGLV